MSEYTPEPWEVAANVDWEVMPPNVERALVPAIRIRGAAEPTDGKSLDISTRNMGRYVALCFGPDREHNARLIIAAPELLDALRNITDFVNTGCDIAPQYGDKARKVITAGRAAIKKAEQR